MHLANTLTFLLCSLYDDVCLEPFQNNVEVSSHTFAVALVSIDFPLLISTHEILNISESTVLKFNHSDSFVYSTTLIYKYTLKWV